ncbi:MAG: hypothetical protein HY959_12355 [Ignavibacteriae bacterium]|nr:hypothetical protein [Ignavibacteriota bacterium]
MKKLLMLLLAFSFLALYGCGNKDENKEVKKDEKTTEQSKPDDVKNENTTAGDVKKDNSDPNGLGLTTGLPQDFPKDIPQPNNSTCNGFLSSSDGTVVTFESKDNLKSVVDFYRTNMEKNGYQKQEGNEYFENENGAMLGFKKSGKEAPREVGFLIGVNKENKITQIVITYK